MASCAAVVAVTVVLSPRDDLCQRTSKCVLPSFSTMLYIMRSIALCNEVYHKVQKIIKAMEFLKNVIIGLFVSHLISFF